MSETYTKCDQCMRQCPVESLRCENGRRRYFEVTGKEYTAAEDRDPAESAYRRAIRRRREKSGN